MAGLLDVMQSPAAMGLLAAGFGGLAGAGRNTPYNNLGRAGLAGLAGYSAADALQQKQKVLDQKAAIQAAIPTLYGQDGTFDYKRGAALGISPTDLKGYAEAPNAGRAKVARTVDIASPTGGKQTVQYDDYGNQVGQGIDAYVAPQLVDTGDAKQFVVPAAGQSFKVGMSPAEVDAANRGWANVGLGRQKNQILQTANDINKEAQRTQVVTGADGVNYLIDKGTGSARPAVTNDGGKVLSGPAAENALKQNRDAGSGLDLITQAEQLLPGATNSGIGAAIDSVNRYFGVTTTGAQQAAQLEALGGALVMKMPRMEGPQSDRDQMLYREMAGKVGDRTVPAAERQAALQTVKGLFSKYASPAQRQPGQLTSEQNPPKNQLRTITRTGTMNGRKVVQYSDGSVDYGD